MKIPPSLKLSKDGHIVAPAMFVDCSRRGIVVPETTTAAGFDGVGQPPATGGDGGTSANETGQGGTTEDPDIVSVVFRLISAISLTPGIWFMPDQIVDFSYADARALKEARDIVNMSARPTAVLLNHTWWDVRARAGRLGVAAWEESSDIPPGTNAPVIVNRRFDARTAAGLETGELDAGSLGISNTFSMSHPNMDFDKFCSLQGDTIDGQIVRWLPEHTTAVEHFALVLTGADPNAMPRDAQFNKGKHWSGYQFDDPKQDKGGRDMNEFIALLQMVCSRLGITVAFTESGPMPEKLEERVKAELERTLNTATKYNGLAAEVEKLGPSLLREGEIKLTADQVLERLPAELAFVPQGKAYLADIRHAVLKAFDAVHVKPDKPQSLGDVELRERKRIECSTDLEYLKDQLALLNPKAGAKFGPNFKVSENEDFSGGGSGGTADLDVEKRIQSVRLQEYLAKKPDQGR